MEKLISIIVPCYNSEKLLDECFNTLKNQTIGIDNLEIIFVNDCSKDQTLKKLYEYEEQFPDSICVVDLAVNVKQGGARNIGLTYATGKYVSFVDSDDWVKLNMFEILYQKAEEYQTEIIQAPFIHARGNGKEETEACYKYGFLDGTDIWVKKGLLIGNIMTFGSQNKFYLRSFIQKNEARFVEHRVYEEPSFVYPLFLNAERLFILDEGLYYYRHTVQSVTGAYMREPGKLYDHPEVQLELLKNLVKKNLVVDIYSDEIEFYFLHTYYIETLYFSGLSRLYLGVDYFEKMQKMVLTLFPEYDNNFYLNLPELKSSKMVMSSVNKSFTQQELEDYCTEVVNMIK